MIRKPLLLRIYDAANMQRWNDKIRPVELRELDKQAHKMIIAYLLGKFEEEHNTAAFNWIEVIEGGIFEFLQRLVITDLKPQLLDRIKQDSDKYTRLNQWAYDQISPAISPLGEAFCRKFRSYLLDPQENINRRILAAAHTYATGWEFNIIERTNPEGYEIKELKTKLEERKESFNDLKGIRQLSSYNNLRNFIDLCGQLRFQIRWSHLYTIPRISVLGHMLIIAMFSYLFSLEIEACPNRCINNYFTGLFHDLPEVLTRDIIHPVKSSIRGLSDLIKGYEEKEMEERIYKLIPPSWHQQMRMYTENEFASIINLKGEIKPETSEEISRSYNQDEFHPRDGVLVKAADRLGAFLEAYLTLRNGVHRPELEEAMYNFKRDFHEYNICGIRFGDIYADFD
ncbi:MAG: HD domain-containing protein [Candidatus Schekmanbacteria bacterium]|nr:HD domain-containing protein [Candidatus Schekmanbacteria bacterium]